MAIFGYWRRVRVIRLRAGVRVLVADGHQRLLSGVNQDCTYVLRASTDHDPPAPAHGAYSDLGYVVCNEAGELYHPSTLSKLWSSAIADLDVPQIRLHDARHSRATLMTLQKVPIVLVSTWLGHAEGTSGCGPASRPQPVLHALVPMCHMINGRFVDDTCCVARYLERVGPRAVNTFGQGGIRRGSR
jgi:hypothetical protein